MRPALQRRTAQAWPYLLAAVGALPAGYLLLRQGFWTSGDGLHHLYRVSALTSYLGQGELYPRWIGEFAFGYGAPVFNFYSPLSYYLAQAFGWLGAVWALKMAMLAGLVASSVLLYHFAAAHVGRWPAIAAALVYAYAPYRLVDLYPRAAFAEHMAFLWLPLILWAYDGLWDGRRRAWQVLSWSGLVLTHSFTALMFAPFFLLYVLWSAWQRHAWRHLAWAAGSVLLAVGLTSFFWLPLALEARFAGLSMASVSAGYRNHLVSPLSLLGTILYDYGTGEGRTDYYFAFGLVPALLLLASLPLAFRRGAPVLARYGVLACLAGLFMVSRLSAPVWDLLGPVLARIQFPWRFLAVSTFGLALAVIAPLRALPSSRWQAAAAAAIGMALLASGLWRLPFEPTPLTAATVTPESLWTFDRETGQAGTTWGGEFLPVWVREQRWALGRVPETAADGPAMSVVAVSNLRRTADSLAFDVQAPGPWTFRLHAYYFPGWQVRLNGQPMVTTASGDLGLVSATVPGGAGRLSVAFESTTPRTVGRWLSALCLILLPAFAWWPLPRRARRAAAGFWAIIVVLVVFLIAPSLPKPVAPRAAQGVFGDRAQMVGAEMPEQVRGGQSLAVELYWLSLRQSSQNDKAFVHLVDAAGQVVAQDDSDPGGGFTPTTRWQPGELIRDRHYLELPAGLAPGTYTVKAGLYQYEPFRNLLTSPATEDGRVDLGQIQVR